MSVINQNLSLSEGQQILSSLLASPASCNGLDLLHLTNLTMKELLWQAIFSKTFNYIM